MRESFKEMLERAQDIKVAFMLAFYEVHAYDDGAYCDFKVRSVPDVSSLLRLAGKLRVAVLSDEGFLRVRLYEDYDE